jgi:hypothetical protein
MELTYIIKFILVIAFMTLTDIAWAFYVIKVDNRQAVKAGVWSMMIMLFGALTTTNYIDDKTLIIAAMIGCFIGTYITVKYHDKIEKIEK